ncbi:TonB-dependent receptor [Nitrincola nitratireducens]|nr:TonB-dependent receptor plug domain-containing protein [Nitrincola nitratireducens]EXJ12909.1 Outer membrane cobalamin translocator [Nitrincola nitratireducens]
MNKPVFAIKPLALLCLSSLSAPLFAQPISSLDSADTRFNPIIVTATLSAKTADETLASVTVIDEEQIRLQQPKDIIDLLKGQPGVDFSSNGGFGKTTSVYTRGAASDSTVLLVDGIRLQSATSGGASWQFLTPNLFERFEIVRGPRGGLYGADAAGGVIQGFLANSQAQRMNVSVGGGSFGSYQVNAGVSGQHNSTRYQLVANQFTTDGIEIKEGEGRRGYDNTSVLARLGQGFDSGADLSLLVMHTQGNTEFVGGNTDYRLQVLG